MCVYIAALLVSYLINWFLMNRWAYYCKIILIWHIKKFITMIIIILCVLFCLKNNQNRKAEKEKTLCFAALRRHLFKRWRYLFKRWRYLFKRWRYLFKRWKYYNFFGFLIEIIAKTNDYHQVMWST